MTRPFSAARFYGDAQAKQLKVDIFKLILKIVLLYRNHVITEADAAPARPKMLSMMVTPRDHHPRDVNWTPS